MRKLITTFAAVGVLGLTACAAEEEEPVIVDEPVVEEPVAAPVVTPAPMMDTTMMDTTAAAQ